MQRKLLDQDAALTRSAGPNAAPVIPAMVWGIAVRIQQKGAKSGIWLCEFGGGTSPPPSLLRVIRSLITRLEKKISFIMEFFCIVYPKGARV